MSTSILINYIYIIMEYQYIVNPQTNRRCRVDTSLGRRIVKNYAQTAGGCPRGEAYDPAYGYCRNKDLIESLKEQAYRDQRLQAQEDEEWEYERDMRRERRAAAKAKAKEEKRRKQRALNRK